MKLKFHEMERRRQITYDSFLPMLLRHFTDDVDLLRLQPNRLVYCNVFA